MTKILIPAIRNVSPSLLSDRIMGIHPIIAPTGQSAAFRIIKNRPVVHKVEWQLEYDKFDEYPYSAFNMVWDPWISTGRCQEMDAWCSISFNGGDWHRAQQTYRFKNEQDRTLFILRWSE